jgi:hypothetical protein
VGCWYNSLRSILLYISRSAKYHCMRACKRPEDLERMGRSRNVCYLARKGQLGRSALLRHQRCDKDPFLSQKPNDDDFDFDSKLDAYSKSSSTPSSSTCLLSRSHECVLMVRHRPICPKDNGCLSSRRRAFTTSGPCSNALMKISALF